MVGKTVNWGLDQNDSRPWVAARFSGECSNCGEGIDEGDDIRASREATEGGWEGRCCDDAALPEPTGKPRTVCPVCHTVRSKSGTCFC